MARNIVICCDGTNNEFGLRITNVVRLAKVLEHDSNTQLLYYDPGVGTLEYPGLITRTGKTISKAFGMAFGVGLAQNVEEAYTFLMDFYEPGDKVFLFGFSRGAYTVRVLAGLLHALGLLLPGSHNLVPYVMRLYAADREGNQEICDRFRQTYARLVPGGGEERRFPVHFLGLWDTVSSVGWAWTPRHYRYTARNKSISKIRHAIALDERRWFFQQNRMFKEGEEQDHLEMWFSGVHSDVGGGYPEEDDDLWRVSFKWMLTEAEKAGLEVNERRKNIILTETNPPKYNWPKQPHESLKGLLWRAAEYFPKLQWQHESRRRAIRIGRGRPRVILDRELVHRSVLLRIRETDYEPRSFSKEFVEHVRGLPELPDGLPYFRQKEK